MNNSDVTSDNKSMWSILSEREIRILFDLLQLQIFLRWYTSARGRGSDSDANDCHFDKCRNRKELRHCPSREQNLLSILKRIYDSKLSRPAQKSIQSLYQFWYTPTKPKSSKPKNRQTKRTARELPRHYGDYRKSCEAVEDNCDNSFILQSAHLRSLE